MSSHTVHDAEPPFCTKCQLEAGVAENAKLRAEVERLTQRAAQYWELAREVQAQRDATPLQVAAMLRVFNAARAFVGLENNGANYHALKANLTLAVRECERDAGHQTCDCKMSCDSRNGKPCDCGAQAREPEPPKVCPVCKQERAGIMKPLYRKDVDFACHKCDR